MSFKFVADKILKDKAYPALAKWPAEPYTPEWRKFVEHWPNTVPCELHEHCQAHQYPFTLSSTDNYTAGSYYTVGLGFFNFNVDYFGLMSDDVHEALKNKKLCVLFYYHEGDNPYHIKERLDGLCLAWELPTDCYRFVSGNTAAEKIPGFAYFPDHELLYWRRNRVEPTQIHTHNRGKDFTVLSRTHKWWRATAMTDLWRRGLLDNSYWSYNTAIDLGESIDDNPIEVDTLKIRPDLFTFLSQGPYKCDTLTDSQHNDHSIIETAHFTNSYCNIIFETHFDADGSGGTFLTEKTFKAIKHGQPFIIVGPPGSLATLRRLGYRTFDHCIDNSYDSEKDNTQRWLKIVDAIADVKKQNMKEWFMNCLVDVRHNQQLFVASKYNRLNNLLERLR